MTLEKSIHDSRIDDLEVAMTAYDRIKCPLSHVFAGEIYSRSILMPGGYLIASKIHKTEHPFSLKKGELLVQENGGEWKRIVAPFDGVTKPGTRRVLFILRDAIWTTYHALREGESTPEQVEDRIIEKYDHPYIKYWEEVDKAKMELLK